MSRFSDSLATPQPGSSKGRGRGRGLSHGRTSTLRSQRSTPYSQATTRIAGTLILFLTFHFIWIIYLFKFLKLLHHRENQL